MLKGIKKGFLSAILALMMACGLLSVLVQPANAGVIGTYVTKSWAAHDGIPAGSIGPYEVKAGSREFPDIDIEEGEITIYHEWIISEVSYTLSFSGGDLVSFDTVAGPVVQKTYSDTDDVLSPCLISIDGTNPKKLNFTEWYSDFTFGTGFYGTFTYTFTSTSAASNTAPTVTTTSPVSAITATTATAGGDVTADGGEAISERGVVYSTGTNPAINGAGVTKITAPGTTGQYTVNLTGLTPSTTYHVRAYATNSVGTNYGADVSFDTAAKTVTATPNQAMTEENLNGRTITLTLSGETFAASLDKTKYTLNNAPGGTTVSNVNRTDDTHAVLTLAYDGTDFDANVTTLNITIAGDQLTGNAALSSGNLTITATVETAPSVATTSPVSSITATTATAGGEVTADGGEAISERGVVYATGANPAINGAGVTKITAPGTTGQYTVNLTGLAPSTTYHVRAYATNSVSTNYGADVSFDTAAKTVTATPNQAMTEENLNGRTITLTLSGETFAASLDKTKFSLNNAPGGTTVSSVSRTDDTHAALPLAYDGTDFDANVSTLNITIAGDQLTGSSALTSGNLTITATVETAPAVTTTSPVSAITATTATAGGEVTADGGEAVSERGIVYSTGANPAINGAGVTKITAPGTTGQYTVNLTGLTPSTTYHVRAYATNSVGTNYGTDVSFDTAARTVTAEADQAMTEENLNGRTLTLTLSGETFAASLDKTKFTLNNAPGGTTPGSVNRTDDTHAVLTLVYDGTDFDANVTTLSITIAGDQLTGNAALTSPNLTITATVETAPAVTTSSPVTAITATTATAGGEVTADGGEAISERGVVYSTGANPAINGAGVTKITAPGTTGQYTASLTGLVPSTTYHVRAYATNSVGTNYGADVSFDTAAKTVTATPNQAMHEENLNGRTLTLTLSGETFAASLDKTKYTLNNAPGGTTVGNVNRTDDTHAILTLAYDGTDFDANVSTLNITIAGDQLTGNAALTSGNLTITATVETAPAVTTTSPVTAITATTAAAGGEVTADGGEAVSERGVVYSTGANPAINGAGVTKITAPGTTGQYTVNLTGLTPSTTYHVRAYATNSVSTNYGADVSFDTATRTVTATADQAMNEENLNGRTLTLTLSGETFIASLDKSKFSLNDAPGGTTVGNVNRTDDTHAVLTLAYDGTDFDANVTTLNITIAGDQLTGSSALTSGNLTITATVETAPAVTTTSPVSAITATTATAGGEATADGGEVISERGVVYANGANPALNGAGVTKITAPGTTGQYTLNLTGLVPSTTYHVRAYATNSVSTNYGADVSFDTAARTVTAEADQTMTEENLNGRTITLTLSGETFAASLDKSKFNLNNAPGGTTAGDVSRTDDTHAVLTLAYDGTDFDADVSTLTITIAGDQLTGNAALTSGNLTITATVETAPTVTTTSPVTAITATTATAGGEATADGGEVISERGVVYATGANPAINGAGVTKITAPGTTGQYTASLTGLVPSTEYHVRAYATNSVDTSYGADVGFTTASITVPDAPTNVTATAGNRKATINFTAPANNGGSVITGYKVLSTPGNIEVSGTASPIVVTGLTNGTTYTFTVKATNIAGDSLPSAASSAVRPSAPSNGGGGGSSPTTTPPTSNNGVPVLVNGQVINAGTATTSQNGGQTVITVIVDQQRLEQKLNQEGNNSVVTIPVNQADVVIGELNGQMVKNMEDKQAVVEVKSEKAAYTLPAQQIKIDEIAALLGTNVELKDIKVQIHIADPAAATVKIVEDAAKKGEFNIVIPPVEFNILCSYGGKTVTVNRFSTYVKRTVTIPEGADHNKITTGVAVEADGSVRHVPTQVIQVNDKYYTKINSLTNSAYAVIWHPIEFKDVVKHWAKTAVNDMGSRMVISGVNQDSFEPDRDITRAEFASIVIRALGLKPGSGSGSFSDVKSSDWYNGAIQAASQYKIISGYGNGKFGPADKITREQAMTMIAKAMSITGLRTEFQAGEVEKLLAGYADADKTAEYAKDSVAACVKTGIVTGKGANIAAPKDNITRAEVAVIVQRLLQKSGLI